MARQPPAVLAQVGSGPGAPQAGLTAAGAEEPGDPGQHRVPIGGRREQDRTVEVAARSTEIGHRHVIAVQRPASAGERERRVERGVVEQEAAQQRVADGNVALPSGRELLADGHATTLTTAIAARSHADRSASQTRSGAPPGGRSVTSCAFVCSGPSSWSTPMATPAPSAAPISARCSPSCSRPAGRW